MAESMAEAGPGGSAEPPRKAAVPRTGGYYWLPSPADSGIRWTVVTCHQLGCEPDDGHDAVLWPRFLDLLAHAWGKDARQLRRALALSYTGVPRGRVTKPGKDYLVLHGEDSPSTSWKEEVVEAFHLPRGRVNFLYDEHETMIPGHPTKLRRELGVL